MSGGAFIAGAVRTPIGRRGGGLAGVHSADLGAHALLALMERSAIDPAAVEDVLFGCVDQVGPQAGNVARTSWLAAGLPEHVPGATVDRQCGSSQQAIHFAAQAVLAGTQDVVVAGGVQQMSAIPMGSARKVGEDLGLGDSVFGSSGFARRYDGEEVSQFRAAELVAERWQIDREEMEEFSVESHRRALRAAAEQRFEREIAPLEGVATDEGPREPNLEKIRSLQPLREGGAITAALASQISDGAAAVLVCSARALEAHSLVPLARIHQMAVVADDPILMLAAPIPATRRILERCDLTLDEIDLFEVNEAFASIPIAWLREFDVDPEKLNVNGGAIALGHPLGASGARLMTTMLHELERRGGRWGLQVMCEAGGQANATLIERLN